jgi:hypothetical protein
MFMGTESTRWRDAREKMGRAILLWLLLGVPIPIIILLALFWHRSTPPGTTRMGSVPVSDRAETLGAGEAGHSFESLKMASSAHAYVRGNTRKFDEWLATASDQKIPDGPRI